MKKIALFLSLLAIVSLACDISVNMAPTSPTLSPATSVVPVIEPATTTPEIFISLTQAMPAPTTAPASATPIVVVPSATATFPPSTANQVAYKSVSLVLPTGLANGISGADFPRVEGQEHAVWELTPGHTVVTLQAYLLQGKAHQPQIFVYPALEYAQLFPGAFESMHRLRNAMNLTNAAVSADQLPAVPFFNAAQTFASNLRPVSFGNGSGIRFLTVYAQYAAPANNNELFYQFQGFSDDGNEYIVAIFPISVPVLAETGDPKASIPAGGVAYPDPSSSNPDYAAYYASVTDRLNGMPEDSFSPTIGQLDALIQSMQIVP